jgi:hypothetical protein
MRKTFEDSSVHPRQHPNIHTVENRIYEGSNLPEETKIKLDLEVSRKRDRIVLGEGW